MWGMPLAGQFQLNLQIHLGPQRMLLEFVEFELPRSSIPAEEMVTV
jgi:hypothetical protein